MACQVHDPKYVDFFCSGQLDSESMRQIGFGEVTRLPSLIERTQAEVAGEEYQDFISRR